MEIPESKEDDSPKKRRHNVTGEVFILKAASRGVLGDEVAPPFGTIVTFGRVRNFETTRL